VNQEELIKKIEKALLKYEKQLLMEEKLLDEELLYLMNN
jgi:hypothetical protein